MRRFATLLMGLIALAGSASAQTGASGGFEVDSAPLSHRGRAIPIGGDAAYGVTFYDDEGWYTAVLPAGHAINRAPEPGTWVFDIRGGGNLLVCSAARYPGGSHQGTAFDRLQAQADGLLAPGSPWERSAARDLVVEDRRMVALTDGARGKPVRVAVYTGLLHGRSHYMTLAIVQVPKGVVMFSCMGVSAAQSRGMVKMIFRVAEGAL